MRHCPHCHHPSIPWWHPQLGKVPLLLARPLVCPHCHHTLERVFDAWDFTLALPTLIVALFYRFEDLPTESAHPLFYFLYGCAALAGLSLWAHTIRYKVKV